MTSIFANALGADFDRLHPMLRKRFGVGLDSGYACVGTGVMSSIRRGPWWTVPFLRFGALRNILVPDVGHDVPFTIENYPYLDPFGRETVTFVRSYTLGHKRRRFDATMVTNPDDGTVLDYLGTHQHLPVDLELSVTDEGGLRIHTGQQRFYEGRVGFAFPMLFSGNGDLEESYDDATGLYRINLDVTNPRFGYLFGYTGTFTCEFPEATDAPAHLKPVRHERRV